MRAALKRSMAVAAFFALSCLSALAGTNEKIYLVTVSGGPSVIEAFGHSLIAVYDATNVKPFTTYEYGYPNSENIFSEKQDLSKNYKPILAMLSGASTVSSRKTVNIEEDRFTGLPSNVVTEYLSNSNVYREIYFDELNLTDSQKSALISGLEFDMSAAPYAYRHYQDNCVTKIRDRLFSDRVLGKKARQSVEKIKEQTSIQEIILASISDAIALSKNKQIGLLPAKIQNKRSIRKILRRLQTYDASIKTNFQSDAEFLSSMKNLKRILEPMASLTPDIGAAVAGIDSVLFSKEVTATPLQRYKSLFTPVRLRQALKEFLITEANTKKLDSDDYVKNNPNPKGAPAL